MLSLFPYSKYQIQSMFHPLCRHAKYKGQTYEYGIKSLELDFHLLFQMKYVPICIVRK